jgi:hypothetical protein
MAIKGGEKGTRLDILDAMAGFESNSREFNQ